MGEFDDLGDEILLEILKKVPIKFAHRCKSVSKRCLNLISSDYFSLCYNRYYSRLANSVPRFALVYYLVKFQEPNCRCVVSGKPDHHKFRMVHFYDPHFLHIDFGPSPPSPSPPLATDDIHVLCCSNGFVLCSDTSAPTPRYYVCNAVNKKWVTIPHSPFGEVRARVGFLCRAPILSFNKNTSTGEDFDISCSYRIVRLLLDKNNRGFVKVEVYVSENAEWAEIVLDKSVNSKVIWRDVKPYGRSPDEFSRRDNAIPCNGSLYWIRAGVLLVIDPYSGQHGTVKLPDEIRLDSRKKIDIGESNGRLRCIAFQRPKLTIYELENNDRHSGHWLSVKFICFQKIKHDIFSSIGRFVGPCSSPPDFRQGFSSIVSHPFDEDVLFLCFAGNITLFNMAKEKLTTIWDVDSEYQRDSHVPRAFPIVLPWWPLLESQGPERLEKANNVETLDLAFGRIKLGPLSKSQVLSGKSEKNISI